MPWQDRDGRVVATAFVLHAMLVGTWAGRVPAIKHALGLSDTALGLALFGMAAGTLLGSWLGGPLARRLGAATVVRGGIPAMAAALVASAFARDLAALFVVLAGFGTLARSSTWR
jgi:MFS-type transporter involved in bile tolerance (Atg22 family)